MQIKFHGRHSPEEVVENLENMFELFRHRYGIKAFRNLRISLSLCDIEGQEVELVDATTSEVLGVFEIYQTGELRERFTAKNDIPTPKLKLVVDNTK